MEKQEIITTLKKLSPIFQSEYAVKRIGLFGSFAKNKQHSESDIGLLVEFSHPIGWKYFSLELFLENQLGRKIDLVTKNALKTQIRNSVLKSVNYI